MVHHAGFLTRIRNHNPSHTPDPFASVHDQAEENLPAKDTGYRHPHDSSFLAERGCLGGVNLPRHPAPAHPH
jgi:hypothetical protein